jgi:DNA-binding beta-propeller fold protein YncE
MTPWIIGSWIEQHSTRFERKWHRAFILSLACVFLLGGCAQQQWKATLYTQIPGMGNSRSVVVDPEAGYLYVAGSKAGAKGSITRLKSPAKPNRPRWRQSSEEVPLGNLGGMCIFDGQLWVGDGSKLIAYPLDTGPGKSIPIPGAGQISDLATDGMAIYFCDIELNTVTRWTPQAGGASIPAPAGVRRLTFSGKRLFAVGGESADVYELDPAGQLKARRFGLGGRFSSLDSIEALPDGTLIVSDRLGGTISAVSRDGKQIVPLLETHSPGDIGFDRNRMLLYVPLTNRDTVEVYRLKFGPMLAGSKTKKPVQKSGRY